MKGFSREEEERVRLSLVHGLVGRLVGPTLCRRSSTPPPNHRDRPSSRLSMPSRSSARAPSPLPQRPQSVAAVMNPGQLDTKASQQDTPSEVEIDNFSPGSSRPCSADLRATQDSPDLLPDLPDLPKPMSLKQRVRASCVASATAMGKDIEGAKEANSAKEAKPKKVPKDAVAVQPEESDLTTSSTASPKKAAANNSPTKGKANESPRPKSPPKIEVVEEEDPELFDRPWRSKTPDRPKPLKSNFDIWMSRWSIHRNS